MQDMNSGYFGYKMSKRAHDAYDHGEKPYTRWTKKDILEDLENNEISEEDLKKLKKYSAKTLRAYFLVSSSWHHTSSYANETNFYIVNADKPIDYEAIDKTDKGIKKERKDQKNNNKIHRKAKVKYGVWEGTKTHPVLVEMESYAIIVGNWAILPDGRKKSIKGKHFCVIKYYLEDNEIPESAKEKFKTIETYITW